MMQMPTESLLSEDELDAIVHQFFAPQPGKVHAWPAAARRMTTSMATPVHWLEGPALEMTAHCLGSGPAVLLVHGWQAQASDMLALAQVLVAQGYTVWLPDLPAHGHSQGKYCAIPLVAQALLQWQQHVGHWAAVVGHSVGGACVVHALGQGLRTDKVVLISAPTHFGNYVRDVAKMLGLPASCLPDLLQKMQQVLGLAPDAIDMLEQSRHFAQQPLFVHAPDDKVVDCAETQHVARSWQGAQWLSTPGLGHFRILQDAQVHQQVVNFVLA